MADCIDRFSAQMELNHEYDHMPLESYKRIYDKLEHLPKALALSDADVKQIKTRYENAKTESIRLQKVADPECRFEAGRAYALEGILRMLGFDEYTEMASGKFYEKE